MTTLLDYYQAVRQGNIPEVKRFIDEKIFPVDKTNTYGFTPLLIACTYDLKHMVDFLLSQGANLYHQDNNGWTVLHKAGFLSHTELYNHLLSVGADPTLKTKKGNLPSIGFVEYEDVKVMSSVRDKSESTEPKTPLMSSDLKLPTITKSKELMLLCPGQGAQLIGMASPYLTNTSVQQMFSDAKSILGYDILHLIQNGPKEKLDSTEVCQVAVYLVSLASFFCNQDKVCGASEVAGFSLGEYTALVISGCIDWADGLRLIQKRGELMKNASNQQSTGMISIVGLDDGQIQQLCRNHNVSIANYLFPKGRVLAGTESDISNVERVAKSMGATTANKLSVSGAFHTKFMESAATELSVLINLITLHPNTIPVWSNFTGKYYEKETMREHLIAQLTSPVQWEKIISSSRSTSFIELAPAKQLNAMMRRIDLNKTNATDCL